MEKKWNGYNNRETAGEKFWRKFKMEPFIPIGMKTSFFFLLIHNLSLFLNIYTKNVNTGCVATVGILVAGLANFRKGGSASVSQKMMRMRVIAQGFTVAAFVAGAGAQSLFADDHVEENRKR